MQAHASARALPTHTSGPSCSFFCMLSNILGRCHQFLEFNVVDYFPDWVHWHDRISTSRHVKGLRKISHAQNCAPWLPHLPRFLPRATSSKPEATCKLPKKNKNSKTFFVGLLRFGVLTEELRCALAFAENFHSQHLPFHTFLPPSRGEAPSAPQKVKSLESLAPACLERLGGYWAVVLPMINTASKPRKRESHRAPFPPAPGPLPRLRPRSPGPRLSILSCLAPRKRPLAEPRIAHRNRKETS